MNFLEKSINIGDSCHIRLNNGEMVTDLTYVGETDTAGKSFMKFKNCNNERAINPSYIAEIISRTMLQEDLPRVFQD